MAGLPDWAGNRVVIIVHQRVLVDSVARLGQISCPIWQHWLHQRSSIAAYLSLVKDLFCLLDEEVVFLEWQCAARSIRNDFRYAVVIELPFRVSCLFPFKSSESLLHLGL